MVTRKGWTRIKTTTPILSWTWHGVRTQMLPCLSCDSLHSTLSNHGIFTPSLAQYATLANHLSTSPKLKDRPIIILIQPSISMSFFDPQYLHPPDKKTLTGDLVEVCKVRFPIVQIVPSWTRELNFWFT